MSRGFPGDTHPFAGEATGGKRVRLVKTLVWYPAEAAPVTTGDDPRPCRRQTSESAHWPL